MSKALILTMALVGACTVQQYQDGPTTYTATADAQGWAMVTADAYMQGDIVEASAWVVERYCETCDPVTMTALPDVLVLPSGVVKVLAYPSAEVVFIVEVYHE